MFNAFYKTFMVRARVRSFVRSRFFLSVACRRVFRACRLLSSSSSSSFFLYRFVFVPMMMMMMMDDPFCVLT